MKVKELVEKLKEFDEDLDVYVCDEIEGNDTGLSGVELGQTGVDSCNPKSKARDVVMLRWC